LQPRGGHEKRQERLQEKRDFSTTSAVAGFAGTAGAD